MEQYISKSAVVAEIKRLLAFYLKEIENNKKDPWAMDIAKRNILQEILSFIDTLEVKEVDIDKEINEHAGYMPQSEFSHDSEVLENIEWAKNEFRYFFELGMSVSKK